MRLLVVVPAWNEEATLPGVLAELRAALPQADVLVVDDGSTDATAAVARSAGVQVAVLPVNLGVGAALRTGFRHARRASYDVLVQVDADGQHDPAQVPVLLTGLTDGADLVVGARGRGDDAKPGHGPRRWAMAVLSLVLSRVAGTRLTDTTSGFRAFNARAIELFAQSFPAEYLGDTVEALVVAARGGLVVREVPVTMRARLGGEASTGPWRSTVFLTRALTALGFALTRPRTRPSSPPPDLLDIVPAAPQPLETEPLTAEPLTPEPLTPEPLTPEPRKATR
ncbi:glycosyltransferase family 2 protein [Lapillicoccus jejuensis]|uniref:Glycosyl transferase family 2 n=1 Tax=Lapillicoccus jejuensis TaxID=402171 RepID=A0A542E5N3_9MICO|nr:glycosyl transferase family 2 [Lapillicoccus jejuensis]